MTKVLSVVLAGGEGKRLMPLTLDRAKPAVPFGGQYRLVDFVLSNLANAGFLRIVVLTQYKSHSLDLHISRTWRDVDACSATTCPRCRPRCAGGRNGLPVRPMPCSRTSISSATRAPITSACSAPTTSTGWIPARCSNSTCDRALA